MFGLTQRLAFVVVICAGTGLVSAQDKQRNLPGYISALTEYMKSLDCPRGSCNYVSLARKYVIALNKLSDIMVDLKSIGDVDNGLPNTDQNFEIVKSEMTEVLKKDKTVNVDLLANALLRSTRLRKERAVIVKNRSFDAASINSNSSNFIADFTVDFEEIENNFGKELKDVEEFALNAAGDVGVGVDNVSGRNLFAFSPQLKGSKGKTSWNIRGINEPKCRYGDEMCIYIKYLEKYIDSLIDFQIENQFSPDWIRTRDKIAATILDLKSSFKGNQVLTSTLDNFKEVCRGIIYLSSKKHDRERIDLIESAIVLASGARSDKTKLKIRLEDLFEEIKASFCDKSTANQGEDYEGIDILPTGSWSSLNVPSRVSEMESALDYLREDNDIHLMHTSWHNSNNQRQPTNRKMERFFYFHNIMIQRYNTARRSEGISIADPISLDKQTQSFSVEYNISPENDPENVLRGFESSGKTCRLSWRTRDLLTQDYDNLMGLRNVGIEEYGEHCEHNYHATLHNQIGGDCGAEILLYFSVSARLPIFYRIHGEINKVWKSFFENDFYTWKDVSPPYGLTIAGVYLFSRCKDPNQVETFWERVGNHFKLNHQPFVIRFRIWNWRGLREKVIVRFFLGLENSRLENYFEIDRFVHSLSGNRIEVIQRDDRDSSIILLKDVNECGWPLHLLLPKGGDKKPLKFRLLVFVNDVHDQSVNIGMSPILNNVMCGSDKQYLSSNGLTLVDDKRDYGFPLNRKWNFNPYNIINNKDNYFGYMSNMINIVHTGEETESCKQEYFE